MTSSLTHAGLVCRTAVVSLVRLRFAQDSGWKTASSDWRADLRQVQAMWDVQGGMPESPVLALAAERLHRRASALAPGPVRDRCIQD